MSGETTKPAGPLTKEAPDNLQPGWVSAAQENEARSNTERRNKILNWLIALFALSVLCTQTVIFLQGFKAWGFALPDSLLQWLGGATVGQFATLLAFLVRAIYRKE